jgi:sugar (pentulose or hexulose) kinase
MAAQQYVVGIDGGTEGIRVGIFTLDGTPVIFAAEPYTTNFPQPGWAEQHPRDWWNALGIAMRRALAESGINKNDIVGLAADTTCHR